MLSPVDALTIGTHAKREREGKKVKKDRTRVAQRQKKIAMKRREIIER